MCIEKSSILFLEPVLKETVWGGERLHSDYGYKMTGNNIGECWGIAANPAGDTRVREGRFKGKTLSELWREDRYLFGNIPGGCFPLLVKLIDARENLSIQVHPDDAYAAKHENGSLGKTECWYVLECEENASLVIGHNAESEKKMADMIKRGQWEKFIRRIPVKKGDFIQIEPGTIHAITAGTLLLETQENSDVTYRVYDYGRLMNGRPRELHIEKSMDVVTVPAGRMEGMRKETAGLSPNQWHRLIACKYYEVYKLALAGSLSFEQNHPFLNISVTEGEGTIDGQIIKKGDNFILPAGYGEAELSGKMELIASAVNTAA